MQVVLESNLAVKKGINYAVLYCATKEIIKTAKKADGYTPITADELFKLTGLTRRQQDLVFKKMEEEGILTITRKGMPAKRYFKFTEG